MGGLSWWHWLVIGGAFILLFGAKKLPDAARGIGRSLRILRTEVSAMNDDTTTDITAPPGQVAADRAAVRPAVGPAAAPADTAAGESVGVPQASDRPAMAQRG